MPRGTILIADDDAAIRTVLNQALARAGYSPRATGNAATRQISASNSLAPAGWTCAVSSDGVVSTPSMRPCPCAHRMSSSFAVAMKILIREAGTNR